MYKSGGLTRYVEKDHRGVIESSVVVPSDNVSIRSVIIVNAEAGGAISDARAATKLVSGGTTTVTGAPFGAFTADAAGAGVNGAEDACLFTFSEGGVYQISGNLIYTKALIWAFDDDAALTFEIGVVPVASFPVAFNGLMTASPNFTVTVDAGDILYINNEATTAGTGTLTQSGSGFLEIYKIGESV